MKPTVGRIVHFYTATAPEKPGSATPGINGQGAGPYAAIVIQTCDGPYVNLRVFAYDHEWTEGSVSEKGPPGNEGGRYWAWPPIGSPTGPS